MRILPLTAPLARLALDRQVDVAVAIFVAICIAFVSTGGITSTWASLLVPFLGLAAITTDSRAVRFAMVLGISAVMAALVVANYYVIANHGFMLVWVGLGLAIACACDEPDDSAQLQKGATLLLALLMGFALIQKLREPYYLDGDLLGGLVIQGEIYLNLISLFLPDWPSMVADNEAAFNSLLAESAAGSVAIAIPATIVGLTWRMTIGSLVAQAVIEILILFRARAGLLLHVAILGFVALVYTTRNENEFLSINCLLGYAMTTDQTRAARPWYVVAVIYLLGSTLIGLRPWLIN